MSAGVGEARVHRPRVQRSPAPRVPRRVSGPARTTRPRTAPPRTARAQAVALPAPGPIAIPRILDAVKRLPEARWLDRLLRGQTWVAMIGVALIGIVALQVSLLKMNAGIGASVEKSTTLERQNADLRASVSQLSSEERIQQEAAKMGLVMPPAGDVRYLRARGAEDARKAAKVMRAPDPVDPTVVAAATTTTGTAAAGTATTTPTATTTAEPATTATPAASTTAEPTATTTATPAATTTPAQPTTTATPAATTQQQQTAPTGATAAPAGATTQP